MTWDQFASMFALLALQLQKSDADEVMARAYFRALKGLELELVAMAAQRMATQGGSLCSENRHWFPKASEWRVLALKIEGERAAEVAQRVRDYHKRAHAPLCLECEDTGWIANTGQGASARWRFCGCRTLRRLEVLGRRPMPALPAGHT